MKVNKSAIIRTIILFISLVNIILQMKGKSLIPIDNELVSETVSIVMLILGAIGSWWHNNAFTKTAIQAEEYRRQLKEKK